MLWGLFLSYIMFHVGNAMIVLQQCLISARQFGYVTKLFYHVLYLRLGIYVWLENSFFRRYPFSSKNAKTCIKLACFEATVIRKKCFRTVNLIPAQTIEPAITKENRMFFFRSHTKVQKFLRGVM